MEQPYKTEGTFYSVSEIAKKMGLSKHTIYRELESMEFTVVKIGKRYLIPTESYDNWYRKIVKGGEL